MGVACYRRFHHHSQRKANRFRARLYNQNILRKTLPDIGVDMTLFGRVQQGDKEAFALLVRQYQRPLFAYLGKMGLEQAVFVNDQALMAAPVKAIADHNIITEETQATRYQVQWSTVDREDEANLTVPQGEVFVLADNRSAAKDSREFGTVPLRDVVGKARQVWLSWGDDGLRWDRWGTVLH